MSWSQSNICASNALSVHSVDLHNVDGSLGNTYMPSGFDTMGSGCVGDNENPMVMMAAEQRALITGRELQQLLSVAHQSLDEAQERYQSLNSHRLKPALYSVFCEIKEKTGLFIDIFRSLSPFYFYFLALALSLRNTAASNAEDEANSPDPQLLRLDKMLVAEGVTGNVIGNDLADATGDLGGVGLGTGGECNQIEHADYRAKLAQIRQIYHAELEKYKNVSLLAALSGAQNNLYGHTWMG
ncbi:unnamed protein product [Protopolystoma xenopodis]|uniref:PBC domain-containing protein n=1 Tax=Protopolystoma xenopodis TaxID=117903 RepID=A0A448WQF5_9PLAT|nr:unnamed protein product [Protopolystoma xenopodis]